MQEHTTVLLQEALYFLNVLPGKRYIDATLGVGGHTEAILKLGGEVLGIDQDPKAIRLAKKQISACPRFIAVQANFSKLKEIANQVGWKRVDGVLFDLGFASFQVEDPGRGLSFLKDGPLDMRMDPALNVTAADLVNSLSGEELANLFFEVGQEKLSRPIAHAIVARRQRVPFETTGELVGVIEGIYKGRREKRHKIRPATKVFMALRIAVNTELENLKTALPQAVELLGKSGRLVVISFQSGEDRIVKHFFKDKAKNGILRILTKKPVVPSTREVRLNPRARSSKLRAAEKL